MDLQKALAGLTPEQLADFLTKNAPAMKAAKTILDEQAKAESDAKRKAKETAAAKAEAESKALSAHLDRIKAIVEKAGIRDCRVTIDVAKDGSIVARTGAIVKRPAGGTRNGSSDLTVEIFRQIRNTLAQGVKPAIDAQGRVQIGGLSVTKRQAICAATLGARLDGTENPGKKAVESVFGAGFFGDAVVGSEQQKFKTGNGDSKMAALVKELEAKPEAAKSKPEATKSKPEATKGK